MAARSPAQANPSRRLDGGGAKTYRGRRDDRGARSRGSDPRREIQGRACARGRRHGRRRGRAAPVARRSRRDQVPVARGRDEARGHRAVRARGPRRRAHQERARRARVRRRRARRRLAVPRDGVPRRRRPRRDRAHERPAAAAHRRRFRAAGVRGARRRAHKRSASCTATLKPSEPLLDPHERRLARGQASSTSASRRSPRPRARARSKSRAARS